ncbi:MAG: hypothetical protein A2X86_12950 [Bdellovibrionales bacterium GWA2_49_15]|nr:MAG: hypothetical protein A2X86_12950 [Bdellovibrionales bacterium GWA2_49_15]HAZ13893.1 hypothetical protein [Bdellovibrionales bacterium]
MEASTLNLLKMNNALPRPQLFLICENMIRKDLEIFRIQDRMVDLFNEIEFFSRHEDEFSSIDFALELAFGKKIDEVDEKIVGIVGEIALNAAFFYRRGKIQGDVIEYISLTAKKITEIIFTASLETTPDMATVKCLELFHKNFPNLEIEYVNNIYAQLGKRQDLRVFNIPGDGTFGGGG